MRKTKTLTEKSCKTCSTVKSINNFSLDRFNEVTQIQYYSSKCKECANNRTKEYYLKKQEESSLNYYLVYYLPEEHYVGITSNPWSRMRKHKNGGRNISKWRVLYSCKTKKEAGYIEAMFQSVLGINGLNY